VIVIVVVIVVVFFVTHMLGDPVQIVLPSNATQAEVEAVRQQLHLNEPLYAQFFRFMGGAVHGDFGNSFWQGRPALGIVWHRFPATVLLCVAAIAIIIPVGVGLGILGALRPGSVMDRAVSVLSFLSVSVVDFWLALMLILVFAVEIRWFPASGYGGIQHLVLPAVTVAFLQVGTLAQVTRASVVEEMKSTYVAAARARGLPESRVILNHGLRNAMVPIVTIIGSDFALLLNGTVIAEVVFSWPGTGQLLIQAINQQDLPLIEACVFFAAVIITIANLLVDISYRFLNPRIRLT